MILSCAVDDRLTFSLFFFALSLSWLYYTTSDVVCQHFFVIF